MIAARGADGQVECFDVTENDHRDHILKHSHAPARIPETLAEEARSIATRIATALDYVGVLAVEMFVVPGKNGPTLLVNEIAPRVHNSGHWTLDGASVSQFEQNIRAIAGWPLAKPVRHGVVTMTNLIGDEINDYTRWLTVPGATVLGTLALFIVAYGIVFSFGIYYMNRLIKQGPDDDGHGDPEAGFLSGNPIAAAQSPGRET